MRWCCKLFPETWGSQTTKGGLFFSHHWCFRSPHRDSPLDGGRSHTDPADLLGGREGRWEGWNGERGERLGWQESGGRRLKVQTLCRVRPSVALVLLWEEIEMAFQALSLSVCMCVCVRVKDTSLSRLISLRLSYLCSSLVNSLRRLWYFLLSSSSSALRAALSCDTAWRTHSAQTHRGTFNTEIQCWLGVYLWKPQIEVCIWR